MDKLKAAIERAEALINKSEKPKLGGLVYKTTGYRFPGRVIDLFRKADGTVMANVESVFHPGMVHIFPITALPVWKGDIEGLINTHFAWLQNVYCVEQEHLTSYLIGAINKHQTRFGETKMLYYIENTHTFERGKPFVLRSLAEAERNRQPDPVSWVVKSYKPKGMR